MPWTAIFAVVALLGFQLAIVAASLYAYNRIRSQQDSQGQQRETWNARLELAVTNSDSAKRMAEQIEIEHFRKLRSMFEVQSGELAETRARLVSIEKELKVCQMKLASEERINRRHEMSRKKVEDDDAPPAGVPAASGEVDMDALLRQFGTPLNGAQPAPAPPPSSFGRTAKPKG